MDEAFPEEDRRLFQVLIDHHHEPLEDYFMLAGTPDARNLTKKIHHFFKKYRCRIQTQVLEWEQIGLQSYFVFTREPIAHPYVVRQYKVVGNTVEYCTQIVVPEDDRLPMNLKPAYKVERIYRPTNNIRLLYNETRTMAFTDEWLLNLKEVMVDQEIGDIVYQQDSKAHPPIHVDSDFLKHLSKICRTKKKLFHYRRLPTFKEYEGFVSSYLDLPFPGMENYLLILDKTTHPEYFVGGFLGQFPLAELYQTRDALICRLQLPEPNFSQFNLTLFTHLLEVCTPYLWLILEDEHQFRLQKQWVNGRWAKFEI